MHHSQLSAERGELVEIMHAIDSHLSPVAPQQASCLEGPVFPVHTIFIQILRQGEAASPTYAHKIDHSAFHHRTKACLIYLDTQHRRGGRPTLPICRPFPPARGGSRCTIRTPLATPQRRLPGSSAKSSLRCRSRSSCSNAGGGQTSLRVARSSQPPVAVTRAASTSFL